MLPSCEAGILLGGADAEMVSPVWDMLTCVSCWISRWRVNAWTFTQNRCVVEAPTSRAWISFQPWNPWSSPIWMIQNYLAWLKPQQQDSVTFPTGQDLVRTGNLVENTSSQRNGPVLEMDCLGCAERGYGEWPLDWEWPWLNLTLASGSWGWWECQNTSHLIKWPVLPDCT